jgi:hypothetical protein
MYAYHLPDVEFLYRFLMTGVYYIFKVFHLLLLLLLRYISVNIIMLYILIQLNVGQGEFYDRYIISRLLCFYRYDIRWNYNK